MPSYLIYTLATGRIARRVSCREDDAELQAGAGEALLEISGDHPASDTTHYVWEGQIWPRPALSPPPAAASVGDSIVIDLPAPAQVTLDDEIRALSFGLHEITFETDGDFALSIAPDFPYLPLDMTVSVS